METVNVKYCSEIEITPELLAVAFWNMDTTQQVRFYKSLSEQTKETKGAYSYGEMQWCMLHDDLKKEPEAYKQYLSMSAFAYDFWPHEG